MEQRGDSIKMIRRDTDHFQRIYSFVKRHRIRYAGRQLVMKADVIPELLSMCDSEAMLDVDILFNGFYVNHALALDDDKRIINAILDDYPEDLEELDDYFEGVKICWIGFFFFLSATRLLLYGWNGLLSQSCQLLLLYR